MMKFIVSLMQYNTVYKWRLLLFFDTKATVCYKKQSIDLPLDITLP